MSSTGPGKSGRSRRSTGSNTKRCDKCDTFMFNSVTGAKTCRACQAEEESRSAVTAASGHGGVPNSTNAIAHQSNVEPNWQVSGYSYDILSSYQVDAEDPNTAASQHGNGNHFTIANAEQGEIQGDWRDPDPQNWKLPARGGHCAAGTSSEHGSVHVANEPVNDHGVPQKSFDCRSLRKPRTSGKPGSGGP
ncbi:uncharacterized protein IL334_005162 [Kwoniella shivajii]|uniref:Uncharacterized protein n=1 Tax=Kwoniella shivajii TaxID=564305 RepID=A0ABZ1D6B6_9TREE|nr:hypothetical protein IL334_005162 [Kwoniella shivajii]